MSSLPQGCDASHATAHLRGTGSWPGCCSLSCCLHAAWGSAGASRGSTGWWVEGFAHRDMVRLCQGLGEQRGAGRGVKHAEPCRHASSSAHGQGTQGAFWCKRQCLQRVWDFDAKRQVCSQRINDRRGNLCRFSLTNSFLFQVKLVQELVEMNILQMLPRI